MIFESNMVGIYFIIKFWFGNFEFYFAYSHTKMHLPSYGNLWEKSKSLRNKKVKGEGV